MADPDLREAWADLLQRRPTLREPLAAYDPILEAWARWSPARSLAIRDSVVACRERWEQGTPLTAAVALGRDDVEDLVGAALEALVRTRSELAPSLHRLAEAWDAGTVPPAAFLPTRGRLGTGAVEQASGLASEVVALLATLSLRPVLQAVYADVHEYSADGVWGLGICPFCGAPPGFADVVEDGRRRLACSLCGGAWLFAKLRCPFCGIEGAQHLVRLMADEAREEGYAIAGCRECRAYLKELDRRVRWNGGPPLVEDWGSPHFDLVARRHGYWRPEASLVLGPSVV